MKRSSKSAVGFIEHDVRLRRSSIRVTSGRKLPFSLRGRAAAQAGRREADGRLEPQSEPSLEPGDGRRGGRPAADAPPNGIQRDASYGRRIGPRRCPGTRRGASRSPLCAPGMRAARGKIRLEIRLQEGSPPLLVLLVCIKGASLVRASEGSLFAPPRAVVKIQAAEDERRRSRGGRAPRRRKTARERKKKRSHIAQFRSECRVDLFIVPLNAAVGEEGAALWSAVMKYSCRCNDYWSRSR